MDGAARRDPEATRRRILAAAVHGVVADALPGPGRPGCPDRADRASSGSVEVLVDPLSARELEVLRLLRSELSGPEMARHLVVSLNTLRTHTKNVYTKLGVTNRRSAVRRADELGL